MGKLIVIALVLSFAACAALGTDYYVANKPGSGAGTLADPFGFADLPDPAAGHPEQSLNGSVFAKLKPGDTVYFRGGGYELKTVEGRYYYSGYVRPAVSGTKEQPITFTAYPGEMVRLKKASGGQKLLGNCKRDYVRYIGFTVHGTEIGALNGRGVEVAYCEVVGNHVNSGDNHDGIRIEKAFEPWIHHNDIHSVRGTKNGRDSQNSVGIKLYNVTDAIIEDNYIHDCSGGIFDKEGGIRNTYCRNYIVKNALRGFYGNNQGKVSTVYVYDNVTDSPIGLHYLMNGSEVHDNLVLCGRLCDAWAGKVYNSHVWNNIVVKDGSDITAFHTSKHGPLALEGEQRHFQYFDHNVYTVPPRYVFDRYGANEEFTLGQMREKGFEKHAQVAGVSDVFVDRKTWELRPAWQTAGRYGDAVGPEDIALVLDLSRYGPGAGGRTGLQAKRRAAEMMNAE